MNRKFWFITTINTLEVMINADNIISIAPSPQEKNKSIISYNNGYGLIVDESYDSLKAQLKSAFAEGY
jgi:uncharacterized protein YlzI (FlbEa/FlbD family)